MISLYNVTADQIAEIHLKDVSLEPIGRSNEALSLGDLAGNRFEIRIRDCKPEDLESRVNATSETVCQAVPNYFGLQRFGATRPVTHLVGEYILRGEYEEAVIAYVGQAFPGRTRTCQIDPACIL